MSSSNNNSEEDASAEMDGPLSIYDRLRTQARAAVAAQTTVAMQAAVATNALRARAADAIDVRVVVPAPAAEAAAREDNNVPTLDEVVATARAQERQARKRVRESTAAADAAVERPPTRRRFGMNEGPFLPRCFPCAYGNRGDDATDVGCRPYARLIELFAENYSYMSMEELCIMVANHYNVHLWGPDDAAARAAGEPGTLLPWMEPEDWQDHFELHVKSPILRIGMLADYVHEALVLNRRFHPSNVNAANANLVRLGSLQLRIHTTKPSQLFASGRGDQLNLNPAVLGNVANLRRIAPLLAAPQNTLGGATAHDTDALATRGARSFNVPAPHVGDVDIEDVPVF